MISRWQWLGLLHQLFVLSCLLLWPGTQGLVSEDERLIGWQGESYKPDGKLYANGLEIHPLISPNSSRRKPWIQAVSWQPRAFIYHHFLSPEECKHIIMLAHEQMKRSTVVGDNGGRVDNVRTSYGTFLRRNQDPVINAIEQRLAVWSHLPASHQEDMQVLRYGPTNKYGPHIDGLERVMSVLMYIIEPKYGGETAFSNSRWMSAELEAQVGNVSECARGHVAYKPKMGDALLFYDVLPDYLEQDSYSMHTGCPVIEGVKWNAVKWIHGKPFRLEDYVKAQHETYQALPNPGKCIDLDTRCNEWAASGECQKNPGYMVGEGNGFGSCRLACKHCEVCVPDDEPECMKRNRANGGFLVFDEHELDALNQLSREIAAEQATDA